MNNLCNECKKSLPPSGDYVNCLNCSSKYHYAPCTSVSKITYDSMHAERRSNWRCHVCRKVKLPAPPTTNQGLQSNDTANQNKQQRDEDDSNETEDSAKRFKDSLSVNSLNNKLCCVQTDITEIKSTIQSLAQNLDTSHNQIKEEIHNALTTITSTLVNLSTQVSDLHNKNDENKKIINEMEKRINKLEQQAIGKNIEIKNVKDIQMSATDVIKNIADSLTVTIEPTDIDNAFRLPKNENKIIVKFSSLNKKNELMQKVRAHRIDSRVLSKDDNRNNTTNNTNYIYLNDELTHNNRRLLWLTKEKVKICNWKFVWVKNGNILARKMENSPAIIINTEADIELITPAI